MAKVKIVLKNLGKSHTQAHLIRFYPFLRKEFRLIKKSEIGSEKVFKELFGKEKFDKSKLYALYTFQK